MNINRMYKNYKILEFNIQIFQRYKMKGIKKATLIIIGYIILILIVAGIESIITSNLGIKPSITQNLKRNQVSLIKLYVVLNFIFWGIEYIINKNKK